MTVSSYRRFVSISPENRLQAPSYEVCFELELNGSMTGVQLFSSGKEPTAITEQTPKKHM